MLAGVTQQGFLFCFPEEIFVGKDWQKKQEYHKMSCNDEGIHTWMSYELLIVHSTAYILC